MIYPKCFMLILNTLLLLPYCPLFLSSAAEFISRGLLRASRTSRTTARKIHEENHFSFGPIHEVAALFFGIFGAMIPALALLEVRGTARSEERRVGKECR